MNLDPLPHSSRSLSILTASLAALSLAFPSSTSAQGIGFDPCDQPPESGNFVHAPEGISGAYKRLVSGDVSGDWDQEVATIKGSTLIVYHGPSIYDLPFVVDSGAIDLCFADDSGAGTPGFLYTTSGTSGDLWRVTFDPASHTYLPPVSVSTSSLWPNAPMVRWCPSGIGSSSSKGLFGVASDLRRAFSAPMQSGAFTPPSVMFTHGYNILDIVPLNWDLDSQMEIAILDAHGVQVREQDGTLRMNRAVQVAGDAIAVVHAANSTDSLAYVTRISGWSKLFLFNQNFTPQGPLQISTGVFQSMASADLDGDNDDDLVLASSASDQLLVLDNSLAPPPSTWFSMEFTRSIDMSMPCDSSVSSGKVLCANLFNDWTDTEDDEDTVPPRPVPAFALVLPNVDGVDGLRLVPQLQEAVEPPLPPLVDIGAPQYEGARYLGSDCDTPSGLESNWNLELGNGWGLTNATEVEMVVRRCEGESNVPVEELHHDSFLLSGQPINGFDLTFHGAENGAHADLGYYDYRYYVEVRPVRRSSVTGNVVRVWRWSVLGLTITCSGTAQLLALPGAGEPIEINLDNCCGTAPACLYGMGVVPSAVPLSEIPPGPGFPGDPPPPAQ